MSESDGVDEIGELTGGTVAGAVRVGPTVRRRLDRLSEAVHDLLRHLEHVGFDGAPRFLGLDEQGRKVLSGRFHDAVASYQPPPGALWWNGARRLCEGEIVCHGDLGPWNTIWRDGVPVGFIDWDFASTSRRSATMMPPSRWAARSGTDSRMAGYDLTGQPGIEPPGSRPSKPFLGATATKPPGRPS